MTRRLSAHYRRTLRAGLAAAAAMAALAGIAAADPPGPAYWLYDRDAGATFTRGQFFAGFTLNGGVQQLPRWHSTTGIFDVAQPALPFTGPPDFDPDLRGVQPGGEIGYVFTDGTFPAWMGNRVRASLYGSYVFAERTENRSKGPAEFGSVPLAIYYGVNGAVQAVGVPFLAQSFDESLKVQRQGFQLGLKLEADRALAPNLSLTPGIAVFGGRVVDSYSYTSRETNFSGLGLFDFAIKGIDERLRTWEVGAHVGARLTWQFRPGWALHFGGTAGPVWMQSRLAADDCLSFVVPLGGTCAPGNSAFIGASSASDRRSTVGFRGTASLGVVADLRYAAVSLGGFMRYDSQLPGIVNPQLANFTAIGTNLAPAHIRFDDGFAYGGFLTLRVPIPN